MQFWTAFFLGFAGSLHCAAMCGPLALAVTAVRSGEKFTWRRPLVFHLGRIATYTAIGALAGLAGKVIELAGLQSWASIGAGILVLAGVAASFRWWVGAPAWKAAGWLKNAFGSLLRQRSLAALAGLGAINGLLPCGLVYVAAAAATATGSFSSSIASMIAFGLGTLPMMAGLSGVSRKLQFTAAARLQRLVPAAVVLVGLLLVLRGLNLGIPLVSPALPQPDAAPVACH